jgi:hypothetical protein
MGNCVGFLFLPVILTEAFRGFSDSFKAVAYFKIGYDHFLQLFIAIFLFDVV